MSRRFTYTASLNRGGDTPTWEGEVEVSYEVAWGSPERGRFGPPEDYDPGAGDAVEAICVERVDGKLRPWGMYSGYIANEDDVFAAEVVEELQGSEEHLQAMLAEASEHEAAEYEGAMDRKREEERDDRAAGWD